MTRHLKCLVKVLIGLVLIPAGFILNIFGLCLLVLLGGVFVAILNGTGCVYVDFDSVLEFYCDVWSALYSFWKEL